jgi:hypothetical protein
LGILKVFCVEKFVRAQRSMDDGKIEG